MKESPETQSHQSKKIISLSSYLKVIANIQQQAINDIYHQTQKELEPIKKVTNTHIRLLDVLNFELRKANGLVVDVEFGKEVLIESKTNNITVEIDKDDSFYNIEKKALTLPICISSHNKIGDVVFVEDRKFLIEAKIDDFKHQKIIDKKVEEKINKVQDAIINNFQIKIIDIKPSYDRAELIFGYSNGKVEKVDFSGSRIERAIIEALYGYDEEEKDIDKYNLMNKAEINRRLPNTLSKQQIIDGVYRINKKIKDKTTKSDFIKIISGREIRLNKDF